MKLFDPAVSKEYTLETTRGNMKPGNAWHRLWVRRLREATWHCIGMYGTEQLAYKDAIERGARPEHFMVLPSIINPNNPLHFMVLN